MEVKKTPKANLENRILLFVEIGLVAALLVVLGAFSYGTREKKTAVLADDNFMSLEDDANMGVEIMDYVEEVKEEVVEEEAIPFMMVEEKPTFNGGDAATEFPKWVQSQLVYPEIAKENGLQGRVTLQFTVNTDGSVSNIKVMRGVDSSLDKEAVRVVSKSPKWKPGKQRDRAVKVTYTFPVIFQLK